jgi:hypothetical protein
MTSLLEYLSRGRLTVALKDVNTGDTCLVTVGRVQPEQVVA